MGILWKPPAAAIKINGGKIVPPEIPVQNVHKKRGVHIFHGWDLQLSFRIIITLKGRHRQTHTHSFTSMKDYLPSHGTLGTMVRRCGAEQTRLRIPEKDH